MNGRPTPARSASEDSPAHTLARSASEGSSPHTLARSASEGFSPRDAVPLRIVKIGGSLFTWPGLPGALGHWLAEQPPATNVLICGGGAFADAVREADRNQRLGETAAHWLCIDAMHVTSRLLSELLPDVPLCDSFPELQERLRSHAPRTIVFDPREFLHAHEPRLPGLPLPQDWSATSDSIAARLAVVLSADGLVLLKSTDPPASPPAISLQQLAAADFVDRHFPEAARTLSTFSFVNLRAVLPLRSCLSVAAPGSETRTGNTSPQRKRG